MPKKLLLVRHGKAADYSFGGSDFERTLTERGRKNAVEMANRISKNIFNPQHLLSSPAIRALNTAKAFAKTWAIQEDNIALEDEIYEADVRRLLKLVNALDNSSANVALFGHNPGISDFANYLTNADIWNIPTAGIVLIEFPFDDWKEISQQTGSMLLFDYPKNL